MNNCQSCGMPMEKPEDYGASRVDNSYCKYCTDEQGKLLPKEVVREKMISFQMQSLSKTREQAEADVDRHMAIMPVWKSGVGRPPVDAPSATGPADMGAPVSPSPASQSISEDDDLPSSFPADQTSPISSPRPPLSTAPAPDLPKRQGSSLPSEDNGNVDGGRSMPAPPDPDQDENMKPDS